MRLIHTTLRLFLLTFVLAASHAQLNGQSTAFNYQGRLTDGGNPANGAFLLQFKLFDALSGGSQIGSTLNDVAVTAANGTFSARLDFGTAPLSGANRWLEIAVRRNGSEAYTTLSPREQIGSSPYSIRTLSAAMADDSQKLGGVNASDYVTAASGGTNFIRNQSTPQPSSSFNITGNGVIAGGLGIGLAAANTRLTIGPGNLWTSAGWSAGANLQNINALGWEANSSGQRFGIGQTNGGLFVFRTNSAFGSTSSPANYDLSITDTGTVGVGTGFPSGSFRMDVQGPVRSIGNTSHFVVETNGGTNSWARLYMRSTNRSWFMGTSQNFNGDQFYLADETSGQTKLSIQPAGGPINFFGNLAQDRPSYGTPKAMVYLNRDGSIARCYNGITGASGGGCGFSVSHPSGGYYEINFGFLVADRFVNVTGLSNSQSDCSSGDALISGITGNIVAVSTFCGNFFDKASMVFVY
jgi:hypothetical protein